MGRAFARLGLLGNPSDGYEGKAIACPVRNFSARVAVTPDTAVAISAGGTTLRFVGMEDALSGPVPKEAGGLEELVLGALRRFGRWVGARGREDTPLTLECATTVPRQVGLAGSSAVIVATMRALARRWGVAVSPFDLAELALATEVEDLGIAAGPMDRVVQAYERVMVMDLAPPRVEASYRPLDPGLVPPLLVSWVPEGGASSGITHSDLRERFRGGDPDVVRTMSELREVVDRGLEALRAGNHDVFANLVDANLRLRRSVTGISEADLRMVHIARARGAAAKLCGSGGAVVIVPRPGVALVEVARDLEAGGFRTCEPRIA